MVAKIKLRPIVLGVDGAVRPRLGRHRALGEAAAVVGGQRVFEARLRAAQLQVVLVLEVLRVRRLLILAAVGLVAGLLRGGLLDLPPDFGGFVVAVRVVFGEVAGGVL